MKIAPSDNPEKESKQFGTIAIVCGVVSLFIWVFAAAGIGTGLRGMIMSRRTKNKRYFAYSFLGCVLSVVSLAYYIINS